MLDPEQRQRRALSGKELGIALGAAAGAAAATFYFASIWLQRTSPDTPKRAPGERPRDVMAAEAADATRVATGAAHSSR